MDKTIADQAVEAYIRTADLIVSFNWALRLGQQDDLPMKPLLLFFSAAKAAVNLLTAFPSFLILEDRYSIVYFP